MHTTTDPTHRAPVTSAEARTELGRFLVLHTARTARGETGVMPMFSKLIDAEWHNLLTNWHVYRAFCGERGAAAAGHQQLTGSGPVGWIAEYEASYGPLTSAWFADASGVVNEDAMAVYTRTATVVTAWDCSPAPGDGDDVVKKPKQPMASQGPGA